MCRSTAGGRARFSIKPTCIFREDEITLKTKKSKGYYPKPMRGIVASVEVNGKNTEIVFITNNMDWAASRVCDLYQSRWAIEVFFKQIKQTLQICDCPGSLRAQSGRFARNLGHSKQAILQQLWSALLLYLPVQFSSMKNWTGRTVSHACLP